MSTRSGGMRSFLKPQQPAKSSPLASTPKARTPGTPGSDEVEVVAELNVGLEQHGGRRGVATASGELAKQLERYRDQTMSVTEKRAQPNGSRHLLSLMETVCTQLGQFANTGDRGNSGNLQHLLDSLQKEVSGLKVLAEKHGKAEVSAVETTAARRCAACTRSCSKAWALQARTSF